MKFELLKTEEDKSNSILDILAKIKTHTVSYSYTFTPTGIGDAVTLTAILTDKETKAITKIEFDISDYGSW